MRTPPSTKTGEATTAAAVEASLDELGNVCGCDSAPTESLCELLLRVCRENGPRPALCQLHEEGVPLILSYEELLKRVSTVAQVLQQDYHLKRGCGVALCVHEQHELVVRAWGRAVQLKRDFLCWCYIEGDLCVSTGANVRNSLGRRTLCTSGHDAANHPLVLCAA